jgi:cytochrome b subunit of formate dehydrogenase
MSKATFTVKRIIHWLLLITAIAVIITGFGIIDYQLVTAATLGLLNKDLSFQIHINLWPVFLVLLVLHVYLTAKTKPK